MEQLLDEGADGRAHRPAPHSRMRTSSGMGYIRKQALSGALSKAARTAATNSTRRCGLARKAVHSQGRPCTSLPWRRRQPSVGTASAGSSAAASTTSLPLPAALTLPAGLVLTMTLALLAGKGAGRGGGVNPQYRVESRRVGLTLPKGHDRANLQPARAAAHPGDPMTTTRSGTKNGDAAGPCGKVPAPRRGGKAAVYDVTSGKVARQEQAGS